MADVVDRAGRIGHRHRRPAGERNPAPLLRTGRVLVVTLAVVFALQQLVTYAYGEPYPAIAQPSFSGSTHTVGVIDSAEPRVVATFADGSQATFTPFQIMADSPELAYRVYEKSIGPDAAHRDDPTVVAWLGTRLSALHSGKEPVSAVLQERSVRHYLDEPRRDRATITSTHSVTFAGAER